MSIAILIVMLVVVVVVVLLLAFFASRRRAAHRSEEQREHSREEFGSEYERTVQERGSEHQAETTNSEVGFGEVNRRYAELKRQHDAGAVSDEQFDTHLKQLMVRDPEGRWWAKSRRTGEWHYNNGNAWVKGTPPDS